MNQWGRMAIGIILGISVISCQRVANQPVAATASETGQTQAVAGENVQITEPESVSEGAEMERAQIDQILSEEPDISKSDLSGAMELPADFVSCEVRIRYQETMYSAISGHLSVEEAMELTVHEACSVPCAETFSHENISEDEISARIEACADTCSDEAVVLDAVCYQYARVIYSVESTGETQDNDESSDM